MIMRVQLFEQSRWEEAFCVRVTVCDRRFVCWLFTIAFLSFCGLLLGGFDFVFQSIALTTLPYLRELEFDM